MKREAMMDAVRLEQNTVFKSEDLVDHLQILEELGKLEKLTDYMTERFDFHKQFEVVIQDCQTWKSNEPNLPKLCIQYYTDGDKTDTRQETDSDARFRYRYKLNNP